MSLFWLTLASLVLTSLAFDIVVINDSDSPIITYVQSLGATGEAPDPASWITTNNERVYDNADPWLSHPSMAVNDGDTRSVSIYDGLDTKLRPCGNIAFQGGIVITYKNGECTTAKMPLVSNTQTYIQDAPHYAYGWIVEDFNDVSTRVFATGPSELKWMGVYYAYTNITYNAVRHSTRDLTNIIVKAYKASACSSSMYMHDAAGCQVAGSKLHVEFVSSFNPNLPAGDYSGVAKIFGRKWHGGEETTTYVNIEISI